MDKKTLECPVCGEHIDAHLQVCPICGEPTGFPPVAKDTERECPVCGETIPAETAVCPVCGETIGTPAAPPITAAETQVLQKTVTEAVPAAAVDAPHAQPVQPVMPPVPPVQPTAAPPPVTLPPPPPAQQTPPPSPVPPAPPTQQSWQGNQPAYNAQQPAQKKKGKTWLVVLLTAIILAGAGVGAYFLFFNKDKKKDSETSEAQSNTLTAYSEVLDSIEDKLPAGATVVARFTEDQMPCLFYLDGGKLLNVNAKTKETVQIEPSSMNPQAVVDYKEGGIIRVDVTPDDKALILLVTSKGVEESGLYRYWVKDGTVDILGKGEIDINGSGYIIHGINMERHIDSSGNITKEFDPGLEMEPTESGAYDDSKKTKSSKTQSSSSKVKTESKTHPSETTPPVQKKEDPPVENKGTGFRFEEI